MAGWGNGPYGITPWGGAFLGGPLDSSFHVTGAITETASIVRVTLSKAVRILSPIFAGDASRVTNWTIASLETGLVMFILGVRPVSDDPSSVELIVLGQFTDSMYQVTASNLVSEDGSPLSDPKSAQFAGLPVAPRVEQEGGVNQLIDLRNPIVPDNGPAGSLVMTSSGLYDREAGIPLLKKLITRRVITRLNEFKHLIGQRYGRGLKEKEIFRFADLPTFKADLEQDAKKEPEVVTATASIRFVSGTGPVIILAVTPKFGDVFSIELPSGQ